VGNLNKIPAIPENYQKVMDQSVYDIGIAVQRIIPFIEELSNRMDIKVDDYIVTIEKEKTSEAPKNKIW